MRNFRFRQGLLAPQFSAAPPFLQRTTSSGSTVDLVISNSFTRPVKVTFAHYTSNYLLEENASVSAAWGSGGANNGPLNVTPDAKWLYWDININTGKRTFGWTAVSPVISESLPVAPLEGMNWFDLSTTSMKVYDASPASAHWKDVIRVFAAKYEGGAFLPPYPVQIYQYAKWTNASQVGLDVGLAQGLTADACAAGPIMFSANNGNPLRQGRNGQFATTETLLVISDYSGQNVKFDSVVIFAQAIDSIPSHHLVSFRPDSKMILASSNDPMNFVSGLVIDNIYADDVGHVITSGTVRNEQWDWQPNEINKPLFCGPSGQLTFAAPTVGASQQVGFVSDNQSIVVNIQQPIRLN